MYLNNFSESQSAEFKGGSDKPDTGVGYDRAISVPEYRERGFTFSGSASGHAATLFSHGFSVTSASREPLDNNMTKTDVTQVNVTKLDTDFYLASKNEDRTST